MSRQTNSPKIIDQWLVRNENQQVKGPYSTDAVSKMILEGIFSGAEEVSEYPDGEWVELSKKPEFYEVLLESLENPVERDEKRAAKMDAETVIRPRASIKPEEPTPEDLPAPLDQMSDDFKALSETSEPLLPALEEVGTSQVKKNLNLPSHLKQQKNISDALIEARDKQLTIELQQIKILQQKEFKKFIPALLAVILLLFGVGYYFLSDNGEQFQGWVLVSPNDKQPPITAEELKNLKIKALAFLRTGVLENLLSAQKNLVHAVEGSPKDLESYGLLCMTYNLMWPYTKQTTSDLKVVARVTQKSRSIDPISGYSDACQAAYLMAKGQAKDARGMLEKTLDQNFEERFILYPFLYLMKGDLLEEQQNYLNAEAYYAEALKAFPNWTWAEYSIGRMYYKQNKFSEAKQVFDKILSEKSDYKPALYGLGLIESKGQGNAQKALDYFSKGFSQKNKLTKSFHLEALMEYTKLLIDKGDTSKALEVASAGLQISPSHKWFKESVITLGGSDKNFNLNGINELILTGEQFARSGDHLTAQAQFKAAFELDPKNTSVPLKIAKSLWELNQGREAISWIDRAIKMDKKNISAYTLKADYLSQKFNFAESSKTLAEATRLNPNNFEIFKTQALIEHRRNNMSSAINYGNRALKLYDADIELLILMAKANIFLYQNLPSRTEEEQDQKKDAIQFAKLYAGKAVDLEPGLPEAQITYAKYIFASQGNTKAESYLKELIKNFPYSPEYRLGLAQFYEADEKYISATEIYKQLVELDPKNKAAHFGLGRCYRFMNQYDLAIKSYLAAAVLDPSDVEPLYETAQLQLENAVTRADNAEISLALSKLKTVRNINPLFPRISYAIAKAHLELGQFQEAIDMIKDEKTKNPNIAEPYILAAEVYDRKNQFKECAAEYSYAIKIRPHSAGLYVKAASCYRKSDALDIAQDMLDIAKQKESGLPEIYRELGYLYEKRGLNAQAKEAFLMYLELSPNALDRSEIESKTSN